MCSMAYKGLDIFVDASFKNGNAGIGIVIKDKNKIIRKQWYRVLNCRNHMDAERMAISFFTEKFKHNISYKKTTLYTDCKNLLFQFKDSHFDVKWIPREENTEADQLAKKAMKSKTKKTKKILFFNE